MNRTIRPDSNPGPGRSRRGVTLVEMLVTVAMLVIIMTILVQVFQAATGALSAAQTIQQLDDHLKLLDATIRSDLSNVTCTLNPPLDPTLNQGYFEYGENEFADNQGEDSDDYVRFTAQAPPGRPFTGRMWVNSTGTGIMNNENAGGNASPCPQPVTITSDYAEIIYFLRNGNLYRRVLLIAPELQSAIVPAIGNVPYSYPQGLANGPLALPSGNTFSPQTSPFGGGQVLSWQGVNDLSAYPAPTGPNGTTGTLNLATQASQGIVLNTLGTLTNRENRAFYSRFANDFLTVSSTNGYSVGPDGIPDDVNGDNVYDLYPTLYPGVFNPGNAANQLLFPPPFSPNNTTGAQYILTNNPIGVSMMAFPFVFPGAYSQAQTLVSGQQLGWIHSPEPQVYFNGGPLQYDQPPSTAIPNPALTYLENINHNPLDLADNLATPINQTGYMQTWWGFPTWRETLSAVWTDPTIQVNVGASLATTPSPTQSAGLVPLTTTEVSQGSVNNYPKRALLPPMNNVSPSFWRNNPQLFCDGYGDNKGVSSFFTSIFTAPDQPTAASQLWTTLSWEDDLIMTNVRSFDVKAYDNALAGYGDLGWGDDLRMYLPYSNTVGYIPPGTAVAGYVTASSVPPYLGVTAGQQLPQAIIWPPLPVPAGVPMPITSTFAHEGRMPPLVEDLRYDARVGNTTYAGYNYNGNIGDDNSIVRLRRVWDTWSLEYSQAPATGVNTGNSGFSVGPPVFTPPIYPSYPAPYPAPLLGIQIQIRVADPTNQRIKSITIRQDFSEKL